MSPAQRKGAKARRAAAGSRTSSRSKARAGAPRARSKGSARVGELCVREVETAAPAEVARDAARRMADRALGTLVVVDEVRRPLGIVTDRDLMVRCIADSTDARRTRLDRLMSGPVAWIHEDASVDAALDEMARLRVRRLVVVDERERLVGVLALDDVLCRELGPATPLGRLLRRTMG